MRTLTYYVAASLDGYIAGPDHQIDGFDVGPDLIGHIGEHYPETLPGPAREALGLTGAPNRRFDTVLMSRHTYELGLAQGLTSPYGHLDQVVFSSGLDPDLVSGPDPGSVSGLDPAVEITADDPTVVVEKLKAADGLGLWLCGGGRLAGALLDQIDELVVKRSPVILGAGRPLIDGAYGARAFELVDRTDVGTVGIETYTRV